jgi:hypothetical protein
MIDLYFCLGLLILASLWAFKLGWERSTAVDGGVVF